VSIEFQAWPKTPRLRKAGSTTITEKIDGTNACVVIKLYEADDHDDALRSGQATSTVDSAGFAHVVYAQSRNRIIYPGSDNAGFAGWVWDWAYELVSLLGLGRHYGEWWGQGIQRRYGMDRKVFSLFNVNRWEQAGEEWYEQATDINMDLVPVLYRGVFSDVEIDKALNALRENGSIAAASWDKFGQKAEGIVLRHSELGGNLKVMLENDDIPKGLQT
jgi:hypothetical protein